MYRFNQSQPKQPSHRLAIARSGQAVCEERSQPALSEHSESMGQLFGRSPYYPRLAVFGIDGFIGGLVKGAYQLV
jgi:hypothetical protein